MTAWASMGLPVAADDAFKVVAAVGPRLHRLAGDAMAERNGWCVVEEFEDNFTARGIPTARGAAWRGASNRNLEVTADCRLART